jgi:hypothetical protein
VKKLPKTSDPAVLRTDFQNQKAWEAICELLAAPIHEGRETFFAHVQILEHRDHPDFSEEELLAVVPEDYDHSFFFVVDRTAVASPEFSDHCRRLVRNSRLQFPGDSWQIQGMQNNPSIANMSMEEFAQAVDADGIFRGFLI